jgi:acyl-CoA thioesterase
MSGDLSLDTAVQPLAGATGRYTASVPDSWSYTMPSGGVLMTTAMRAMQAEIADASFRPTSATTLFCSPVPAGPLEIRVEVLRRGNVAAQVRAALSSTSSPGPGPGLEVSATFTRERQGPDLLDARPPAVPSPLEAHPYVERSVRQERQKYKFLERFDVRLALGHLWSEPGWVGGEARFARWFRYLAPQRLPDGTLDPLAIPPVADTMPHALFQGLGPDAERFFAPSLDLTVHFLDPVRSDWLLVSCHARRARLGYCSAEVEIWSEDGRLAGYGTQMMLLRSQRR